ncbi:hypothetical protein ABDD95_18300 [Mucilaginibacter sp. PAMB04274]|uniref:hypothetical protein n=1 Tax=Mucilaginibacter sp. PAMB04274 TaxID=3138568 RepID=UPI0031F719A7
MMKLRYYLILCISLISLTVKAQQNAVRGQVIEAGTNNRLADVLVRNTNNNQVALTTANGTFDIRAVLGNILIFSSPGYVSDTLYLADLRYKSITMTPLGIALREVNVRGQRFDPRAEYPQVYQKSKVYVLSPTTWFGKEAKDARRLKRYFEHEEKERRIDSVFTKVYVGSIVPLKGRDLEIFMNLYRPTYEFVRSNAAESMAVYINDSYKKWLALPPEKRTVPKLSAQ